MRLDWLDDILAVLDSGSLNKAAERRLITQPAFSRRIKMIEEMLGIDLVDRSRKPARPVAALLDQEPRVRELAVELRALIEDLRRESRQTRNRIVIASQHAITTSVAPAIVGWLSEDAAVSVRQRSANHDECLALLFTNQAEVALTYRLGSEGSKGKIDFIEDLTVGRETLLPVVSASWGADFLDTVSQSGTPVIAYPGDVFLGTVLNGELLPRLPAPANLRIVAETALTLAVLQMAKTGLGLGWVPRSLAADDISAGALLDLSPVLPSADMEIVASRLVGRKSEIEEITWGVIQAMTGSKRVRKPGPA